MSSYSITESTTFTVTHARHMAAKISADLKRMQRFYGYPSDSDIASYETEVTELLKAGYLGTLTTGFLRNGQWIEPTLRYTARDLAGMAGRTQRAARLRDQAGEPLIRRALEGVAQPAIAQPGPAGERRAAGRRRWRSDARRRRRHAR